MKIVVIGGTGLIGTKLVNILRETGHEALAASPSSGVNTITGEGLAEALAGAQVVVDLANAPAWEDKAVLEFFEASTLAPFDQAHHHAHVLKNRMRPGQRSWVGRGWRRRSLAPSRIEIALFDLALRLSVVIDAATGRLTLAMSLSTSKGAAQVLAAGVAGVGQKKDPTVPAARQALPQPGFESHHRPQHDVIRQHQGSDYPVAIPPRVKSKTGCDLSCKKPRLSL